MAYFFDKGDGETSSFSSSESTSSSESFGEGLESKKKTSLPNSLSKHQTHCFGFLPLDGLLDFVEDFGVLRAAGVCGIFLLDENATRTFFVGESWVSEGTKLSSESDSALPAWEHLTPCLKCPRLETI